MQLTTTAQYTPEQVQLIKQQIAPQATDNELKMFLYQCQRTGLDALTRQIYCIHRGGKMTIQTSIDGFRVIAERSGSYAGQDAPEFTYDGKENVLSAKVTVYKFSPQGQRYPAASVVAFLKEYSSGSGLWAKMPHVMLAKVAEAQALRKAYPQDLSGLYTHDEMEQADERVSLKDAKVQMNDIQQAIMAVLACKTINELKDLKATLPAHVIANKSFIDAGVKRYEIINNAPATIEQRDAAEQLLDSSSYDSDERDIIMIKLEDGDLTNGEIETIIADLKLNQAEPVNPSQKDISKKVAALVGRERT